MAKTLKDLLLALLNATLILVALCLFLGWKLARSVENIQDNFRESLHIVQPLREQAQGVREDLASLRADLSGIRILGDDEPELKQKLQQALVVAVLWPLWVVRPILILWQVYLDFNNNNNSSSNNNNKL